MEIMFLFLKLTVIFGVITITIEAIQKLIVLEVC